MKLITNSADLKNFCKEIENLKYITIDTEFLRDKTYYPKLCLIQIASDNIQAIIDPLSENINLQPLTKIFTNQNILKIFHAATQDLEIIFNYFNVVPKPIFDTQLAAMMCGMGYTISYAALVKKYLDITLDKSSQFTNWQARPLSQDLLDYAISDVTYLIEIYKILLDKITKLQRYKWLEEELDKLCENTAKKIDIYKLWHKIKCPSQDTKILGRLKQLAAWRETKAQDVNIPKNHLIKDNTLVDIACKNPKNADNIKNYRNGSNIGKNIRTKLIEVASKAKPLSISEINAFEPNIEVVIPEERALINLSTALLCIKAKEHNIADKIIATKNDIAKYMINNDDNVEFMLGWRFEIFGKYLLDLKNGKLNLKINNDEVIVTI